MSGTKLKRKLSTFDLTMIAIGSTIGSGIFLTPADIATALPSPGWILLVWAVGGLVALSGALTFAELAARFPEAGGVYAFLKRAYGPVAGYLYGWANLTVVTTGAIAALSVGFSTYMAYILREMGLALSDTGETIIAIGGIVLVTLVNVLGVKSGSIFSNIFTVLKLLGIALLVFAGFFLIQTNHLDFSQSLPQETEKGLWTAFAAAMVGVLWSYGGWQHASYMAAEAVDPRKSVARAMVIGALVITGTYLLVNLAYMQILPLDQITGNEEVAASAMRLLMGSAGGIFIALAIFVSTYGTTGIYTLTAPRIYYQMSEDRTFFPFLARLHPRWRTPMNAIVLQSALAIVLILFWGTFSNLIKYVVFTDWIFMTMAAASIFFLKGQGREDGTGFRAPLYPLPPLVFIGISVWFLVNTLIGEPVQALAGLGLLVAGLVVYAFWRYLERRAKRKNGPPS